MPSNKLKRAKMQQKKSRNQAKNILEIESSNEQSKIESNLINCKSNNF